MTLRTQLAGALLPAALLLFHPASAQASGSRVGTARIAITPSAYPAAANANEFEKLYLRAIVVDDGVAGLIKRHLAD